MTDKFSSESNLCLRGIQIPQESYPAIIKYIKTQKNVQELDLSATGLRGSDINHFIVELARR
jgi:hypothetical protein